MGLWLKLKSSYGLEPNLLVLAGTIFVLVTSYYSWSLLLPLYLRQLGASDFWVGISYALIILAYTLGQVFGGLLSDKLGRKPLIAFPTFCFFPLYLLASLTRSWVLLLGCLLLADIASAFQDPSFTSIIAESVPKEKRGVAFGIWGSSFSLSLVIGPLLGSLLLKSVGIPKLILATGILSIPCGLARLKLLRETGVKSKGKTWNWFNLGLNADLRWFLGASVALMTVFSLTIWGPFIALYAKDVIKLTGEKINLLFTFGGISAVVFSILGGKVVEKFKGKKVFLLGVLLHPLFFLPWLYTRGFLAGVPFFLLTYLFSQGSFVAYRTILSNLTTETNRSSVVGLFGTVTGVISASAPWWGMAMRLKWSGQAPFWAAAILGLLALILTLPVAKE